MGHTEIVQDLIKAGAAINHGRASDGVSPLFIACHEGKLDAVTELIAAGGDVHQTTTDDHATPLLVAALGGHLKVVQVRLPRPL